MHYKGNVKSNIIKILHSNGYPNALMLTKGQMRRMETAEMFPQSNHKIQTTRS